MVFVIFSVTLPRVTVMVMQGDVSAGTLVTVTPVDGV
jgi:hypothetical protein